MDPEFVDAFLSMIRQWEPRQIALDGESDPEDETRAEEAVDSSSVP